MYSVKKKVDAFVCRALGFAERTTPPALPAAFAPGASNFYLALESRTGGSRSHDLELSVLNYRLGVALTEHAALCWCAGRVAALGQ